MDWKWLIGLIFFFIAAGTAAFYLYAFVTRTRNEFSATQPDLRVTNLSAMSSGNVLTLYPELENAGGGVAYDCMLHMGGWEGHFAVKKVHPRGPRYQKHVASIVLGPDAPIRTKPISNGYLRLRYQDCWGHKYDRWYQVTQVKSNEHPLYNVHIDLDHSDLNEPHPSFWEMRKFLRAGNLHD
ncbi:MAG TPA: hypothetical protein VLE03_04435 [Nitrospiraceae bacterium]|nr:hypothetical protein [Nitrospiraceae bacterium]